MRRTKMQTQNLIQTQANVIKITSLKQGDVVKILEPDYANTYHTFFGVVIDMLNSGEKQFIQIAMYSKVYDSFETKIKTYSGNVDLTIFPATIMEVEEHFKDAVMVMERDIVKAQKELNEKINGLNIAKQFISGEMSKKLTECSFRELTQIEYNEQKNTLLN